MADIKSPEQRSRNMARIRSKDTEPEIYIRKKLFAAGFRYRKNDPRIPGHPDIYLPMYRTAIFVHGCFWHRHEGCRYAYMPKSRTDYWEKKFQANKERDRKVLDVLTDKGFRVIVVWECCIRRMLHDRHEETEMVKKITETISAEKQENGECYVFE